MKEQEGAGDGLLVAAEDEGELGGEDEDPSPLEGDADQLEAVEGLVEQGGVAEGLQARELFDPGHYFSITTGLLGSSGKMSLFGLIFCHSSVFDERASFNPRPFHSYLAPDYLNSN